MHSQVRAKFNLLSMSSMDFARIISAFLLAPVSANVIGVTTSEFYPDFPISTLTSRLLLLIGGICNFLLFSAARSKDQVADEIKTQPNFRESNFLTLGALTVLVIPAVATFYLIQNTWVQRFNLLFNSGEDTAAWAGIARSLIMEGHFPYEISHTEYFLYGGGAIGAGAIGFLATLGTNTQDLYVAITSAINVVFINYIFLIASTIGLSILFLSHQTIPGSQRFPQLRAAISMFIGFTFTIVLTSAVAVSPLLTGAFLGFATLILLIGLLTFLMVTTLNCHLSPSILFRYLAIAVTASTAISIWPYSLPLVVVFSIGLIFHPTLTSSHKLFGAIALLTPVLLTGSKYLSNVAEVATIQQLNNAAGTVASVDATFVLFVSFISIAAISGLHSFHRLPERQIGILDFVAFSLIAFLLTYIGSRILGFTASYGLGKFRYLVFALALLPLGLLLVWIARQNARTGVMTLLLAFVLSIASTSNSLISILDLPTYLKSGGTDLPGSRIRELATQDNQGTQWSCEPDETVTLGRNYLCNRWASALSTDNSELDFLFRAALLDPTRNFSSITKEFRENTFLVDRKLVPSSEIMGAG